MFEKFPHSALEMLDAPWSQIEPYAQDLLARPLDAGSAPSWLSDWSRLAALVHEIQQRLYVATTVNTADEAAERRYKTFLDHIFPAYQAANQKLKEKLLASGLEPDGFEVPLRNLRAEADLFRTENLPLQVEELKLSNSYDKIIGAQSVTWEGEEVTLSQLHPVYGDTDRGRREAAWRLASQRQLHDRELINQVWGQFLALRKRLAANAGKPDFRAYRWQRLLRFDYTPEDCKSFHHAIETAVVPAAERLYEKRRRLLGVSSLRPWDLEVDPLGRSPLRPFHSVEELETGVSSMFHKVDPQIGGYFDRMRQEGLLDVSNRKNKAPGAYCTDFALMRLPFIFGNAVGLHDDIQMLLHEGGHAVHVFEAAALPYFQQTEVGAEFSEVASMGMELLASPYLPAGQGGFYTQAGAARALSEHLEGLIRFWPYMAVVDAFQHWVYENHQAAAEPRRCDAQWAGLWDRFMRGVDWTGLEAEKETGWQRKLHIFEDPFYYVEYGLAQLGAVQIWRRALQDQAAAVADYRSALALGGTVALPKLYAAAGARLAFDAATLQQAVDLIESKLQELEAVEE